MSAIGLMRRDAVEFSWRKTFAVAVLFFASLPSTANSVMTVGGPISTTGATVTGDVTVSSFTASSMTFLNSLRITGSSPQIPGGITLMQSSVTYQSVTTTATSYMPVPISTTAALSKPGNYFRISVNGLLSTNDAQTASAYLTVMRGSTDLGDSLHGTGFAIATSSMTSTSVDEALYVPVGVNIIDAPGDTSTHIYQVYIRSSSTSVFAGFVGMSVGSLLVEEISR